jgi:hypothetical protein
MNGPKLQGLVVPSSDQEAFSVRPMDKFSCFHHVFMAREDSSYAFGRCVLQVMLVSPFEPATFKTWVFASGANLPNGRSSL